MLRLATLVAFPGPPAVITYTVSNTWNEPMTAGDQDEHQRRPQQRQRHPAELLDLGGPVYGRGLIEAQRDRLQAGQEEQHVVAGVLPDVGERDDRHRGGLSPTARRAR